MWCHPCIGCCVCVFTVPEEPLFMFGELTTNCFEHKLWILLQRGWTSSHRSNHRAFGRRCHWHSSPVSRKHFGDGAGVRKHGDRNHDDGVWSWPGGEGFESQLQQPRQSRGVLPWGQCQFKLNEDYICLIIIKVFLKHKILSLETILSTHTHTRTHTSFIALYIVWSTFSYFSVFTTYEGNSLLIFKMILLSLNYYH